jgi:DNA-binding transcriptional MocR family regulator
VADDPLLGKLYASAETPIPDDQMEPVSVQTLAKTLDLSFETARRRVRAMEARGWCARRRGGVYVPTSMALSPEMRLVMTAACGHLQRMYSGLWRLGVRFDPPAGG